MVYLLRATAKHRQPGRTLSALAADLLVFSLGRQAYTWQCSHESALQG